MSDTTAPSSRGPKALKTILITHLVIATALVAFGFFMHAKVKRFTDSPEVRQADQAKIQDTIAKESDIERLRAIASNGWRQESRNWELMLQIWDGFFEGLSGLVVANVSLACLAGWGLTRREATP
ncbi:MAG TPA: hypothetical protein VGE39_21075 [Prosthecobacter sp.]